MPSHKEQKEKEFREEVADHAMVIMENGVSREEAIIQTKMKYDLPLGELEKIVPKIEACEVSKKREEMVFTKADGKTKVLVTN